jgi:hypothetical protein
VSFFGLPNIVRVRTPHIMSRLPIPVPQPGPEVFRFVRHSACERHHWTGDDSYHKLGPRGFAEVHKLNIRAIVARLSARPIIRVESAPSWDGSETRSTNLDPRQPG